MYHWGKWERKTLEYIRDSNAFLNISVGSVRSGKTISTLARWILFLGKNPNKKFAMIGVTMGALVRNVIEPLMSMLELEGIPYDYKPGDQKLYVDGKSIALFGLDKANAEKKIQGYSSAGTLIDELTTIPEAAFNMVVTRNSESGAKIFATSNPANPNHYVYQDYIQKEEIKQGSVKVFTFKLEDNPNLTREYIEHLKQLYPEDSVFYKRYILGQWVSGHGIIYSRFTDENIYHEDRPLDYYDYLEYGSDYGASSTTCFNLVGVKEFEDHNEFDIIAEGGYNAKAEGVSLTDDEIVDLVVESQNEYGLGKGNVFYPSHDAKSFKTSLEKRGDVLMDIETFTPDTLECIGEISSLFNLNYLRVHSRCVNTIECLRSYEWDSRAAQRGEDKPLKVDDHYCDSIRAPIMNHLFDEDGIGGLLEW